MWHCRVLKCDASYSWRLCPFRDEAATPRPSKLHTIKVFNTANRRRSVLSTKWHEFLDLCVVVCALFLRLRQSVLLMCRVRRVVPLVLLSQKARSTFLAFVQQIVENRIELSTHADKTKEEDETKKKRKLNGAWKNAV